MRRTAVKTFAVGAAAAAFAAWLVYGGPALGQKPLGNVGGEGGKQPPPLADKKDLSLEEMLAQALKANPDIRVAESKLREAEAKLNRTRLQVMQKVIAFQHTLEAQRSVVKEAEVR